MNVSSITAVQTSPSGPLQQKLGFSPIHVVPFGPQRHHGNDPMLFHYEPLAPGEIRLLTPTNDENGLSWTMKVARLDDETLQFDALSYVWGSQNQTYSITCNEKEHRVHHNLYTALPHLARRYMYRQTWRYFDITQEDTDDGIPFVGQNSHWAWKKTSEGDPEPEQPQRPIWIDALCINQADPEEKLIQVAFMNEVYRKAKMVWVWLGFVTEQSRVQDAVDVLPVIACAAQRAKELFAKTSRKIRSGDPYIDAVRRIDSPTWRAVVDLLANEWFRRVWIIQEYVLAEEVTFLSGQHAISAYLVENAVHRLSNLREFVNNATPGTDIDVSWETAPSGLVVDTRFLVHSNLGLRPDLLSLDRGEIAGTLLRISHAINVCQSCFLPQDRVLGILGILDPEQYKILGVDLYHVKDLSELYTKFSALTLPLSLSNTAMGDPWGWLAQGCREKLIQGLPSWVPDLHNFRSGGYSRLGTASRYKASARRSVVANGQQPHELVMRGTLLYNISSVCAAIPTFKPNSMSDYFSHFKRLATWEKHARAFWTDAQYIKGAKRVASMNRSHHDGPYWRSLIGDQTRDEKGTIDHQTYQAFSNALHRFSRNFTKFLADENDPPAEYSRRPYKRMRTTSLALMDPASRSGRFFSRLQILEYRRMFYTEVGMPGFADEGVSVGDWVCVFNGAPIAHILRRTSDRSDEAYTLVGEAYVHGLMNGEVDGMGLEDRDLLLV